jgi:competence CoiA-like predicted nuclease
MKGDQPAFACALCATPVYIVSSPEKRFFFRHRTEDGSCPAQTRSSLTQAEIRSRKYHGLRESEAHKRIKRLIERSLVADPLFQTESIRQERRWRSRHDPALWRQPDVQAICGGGCLAFEAQLSTTFLNVVVERRMFYREEGALLIWILGQLNPDCRRLTTDDLLFSNNSNILVVDEETTRLSEERHTFFFALPFPPNFPRRRRQVPF